MPVLVPDFEAVFSGNKSSVEGVQLTPRYGDNKEEEQTLFGGLASFEGGDASYTGNIFDNDKCQSIPGFCVWLRSV